MKNLKLFIPLAILFFAFTSPTNLPRLEDAIAYHDIGTDSVTGLREILATWRLGIDKPNKTIAVEYSVLLIAPNGKVASVFDKGVYTRYNAPTNARFDSLMQSPVGRAIAGLIQLDVNAVDTITHLSNLQQTNP